MNYVGNKSFLVPYMRTLVQKIMEQDKNVKTLYDPFCGGLNMSLGLMDIIDVKPSDNNQELVDFYKFIQQHQPEDIPDDVTKEQWFNAFHHPELVPKHLLFWYKYAVSYRGIVRTSRCGYVSEYYEGGKIIDNVKRRKNKIIKELPSIKKLDIYCNDYRNIKYEHGQIVYFDPPYNSVAKKQNLYGSSFNHKDFETFILALSQTNYVICSEYKMNFRHFKVIHEVSLKKNRLNTAEDIFGSEFVWIPKQGLISNINLEEETEYD